MFWQSFLVVASAIDVPPVAFFCKGELANANDTDVRKYCVYAMEAIHGDTGHCNENFQPHMETITVLTMELCAMLDAEAKMRCAKAKRELAHNTVWREKGIACRKCKPDDATCLMNAETITKQEETAMGRASSEEEKVIKHNQNIYDKEWKAVQENHAGTRKAPVLQKIINTLWDVDGPQMKEQYSKIPGDVRGYSLGWGSKILGIVTGSHPLDKKNKHTHPKMKNGYVANKTGNTRRKHQSA